MSCWRKCIKFVRDLEIRVEPLIFLLAACNSMKGIMGPGLSEDKMRRVYGDHDKKFLNKKMVMWDQNFEYVNLPIACIVGIIYGGYSDYHGRKLPLLIGIASVLIDNATRILIWSPNTDWPLQVLFPCAAITGLMGDFLLTMSCINAYVTDQFPDKSKLSVRMVVVSILFSLGSFCGSQLTDLMLKHLDKITILCIAEGIFAFIFVLGAILLDNKIPHKRLILNDEEDQDDPPQTLAQIAKQSFLSLWESVKIFTVPREGHRRLFLYLCFFANFLDQFVFGEEKSLIGTYTRLPPFNWNTHDYALYKSWRPIVQISGMFVGLLILKKLFRLRDTMIITLAIFSMGICVVAIGLAQSSWIIYASLPAGSLHGMLNPLTYAFMSFIVEPQEIGKAYAISSIAQKLAGIAQTAILQNIYTATVDWYQGFVWLLMGGVSFVAVGIYGFVHVLATRECVMDN